MRNDFVAPLTEWYEREHRRDMPWRQNPTPYRVWISEIMLQQTRIDAAIDHFLRFCDRLPDVNALANVSDDELMKLWEGLGYYSRARNLKKAAGIVMEQYGGELPRNYEQLLALPGVGEYTAGAIASIAYGLPVPAVDGNVMRVLARLTDCHEDVMQPALRKQFRQQLETIMPKQAGSFNQGLMELGERVCLPNTAPRCEMCPIAAWCEAYRNGTQNDLPVRVVKTKRRTEQKTVLVLRAEHDGKRLVLLHKRPENGLLAGLWELPNIDGVYTADTLPSAFSVGEVTAVLPNGKHIFSHIEWKLSGLLIDVPYGAPPPDYIWASADDLRDTFALPTAFQTYSKRLPILLSEKGE